MNEQELKMLVAQYLQKGISLSDIQDLLEKEHQFKIKFMDLRLLAADLEDVDWTKFDPEPPKAPANEPIPDPTADPTPPPAGPYAQKTQITVSKIVRPGFVASGNVVFASGGSAEWMIDQQGRPGIDNLKGNPPSEEDVRDFMMELQRVLGGGR